MRHPVPRAKPAAALLVIASLLAACATERLESSATDVQSRLPFLRPGLTALAEVEARLGEPLASHPREGVRIWRAWEYPDGGLRFTTPGRWLADSRSRLPYDLVLQFGDDGVLRRGSLVHGE